MSELPIRKKASARLAELDALRGIAAMLVVLFHYTTRFDQLYGHAQPLVFSVPWGHYGVNLFFLISGFVIYMTLERTRSVADFIVSRFSRLYPAFWAAVIISYVVVSILGLPEKVVSLQTMLFNFLMFHGLFRIPHVDSVYWTLEVELLFYVLVLIMFRFGYLNKIHLIVTGLLLLRLIYFLAEKYFAISLPWIVGHLLVIKYIPWFSIGIMVYRIVSGHGTEYRDFQLIVLSVFFLGTDSLGLAGICIVLSLILYLAASGHIPVLRWFPLVWLGNISYTLYLLHENIGWAMMLQFKARGVPTELAIACTIVSALIMASFLTRVVEKPAMGWIRARFRGSVAAA